MIQGSAAGEFPDSATASAAKGNTHTAMNKQKPNTIRLRIIDPFVVASSEFRSYDKIVSNLVATDNRRPIVFRFQRAITCERLLRQIGFVVANNGVSG